MGNKLKLTAMFGAALTVFILAQPGQAYAWGHHDRHGHYRVHNPYPAYGGVFVSLPRGSVNITIGRSRYYYYDGVYYANQHRKYVVVAPPPQVVIAEPVVTAAADNSFTVNIPDTNGGYTAVVIRKSGNGFVGPQGEFYREFPKVEQLKVMYGK